MREAALSIYQEYLSDKVGNKATWQQGRQRQLFGLKKLLFNPLPLYTLQTTLEVPSSPSHQPQERQALCYGMILKKKIFCLNYTKVCKTKIKEESKASPGKFLKSPSFLGLLLPILDQLLLDPLHNGHLAFKHCNAHHTLLQSH